MLVNIAEELVVMESGVDCDLNSQNSATIMCE